MVNQVLLGHQMCPFNVRTVYPGLSALTRRFA
jgi:hypothetical protein